MRHFTLAVLCICTISFVSAQNVGINDLTPDSTLSITNKLLIGGTQGDVVFKDDMGSILFPATAAPNESMIYMFDGGTTNADRMVISHSPSLADHGLMFTDVRDAFWFVDNGSTLMSIDYNLNRVGIGMSVPSEYIHFKAGSQQHFRFEGPNNFLDIYSTSGAVSNGIRFYDDAAFQGGMFYFPDLDLLNISSGSTPSTTPGLLVDLSSARRLGIRAEIDPNYQVAVGGNINIRSGAEASLTTNGYLQTGLTTGLNLVMDNNEITARSNGAKSPLWLQPNQGNVVIGTTSSNVTSTLHVSSDAGENPLRVQRLGSTKFLVDSTGVVLVNGFSKKAGYELNVDGQIVCEEVLVQNSADWPDYVFAEDYALPSLAEVERHIKEQKHLPDIPSAAQVAEEGILLADMEKAILRKVEELTLYVIQQSKEIEQLKKQNAELRAMIVNDND